MVYEHKMGLVPGFTSLYRINRLVYFEQSPNSRAAIEREKQIKGWSRKKKISLIEEANVGWLDLSADWYEPAPRAQTRPDPSPRSG
jgi:putative endonuclease